MNQDKKKDTRQQNTRQQNLKEEIERYRWSYSKIKEGYNLLYSELQQKEQKLVDSEKKYRLLFENVQEGILLLNAKTGKIEDSNPYIQTLLGYSPKEFVGKQVWQISPLKNIIPNKGRLVELQKKKNLRYENLPLETKSGNKIEVEFISSIYDVGEGSIIQCNIRDITERKIVERELQESQSRFRGIFENSTIGISLVSSQGRWLKVNPSLCKITGYSEEELLSKRFKDITYPEDMQKSMDASRLLLSGKASSTHFEKRYFTKGGKIIWVSLSISLILDIQKKPLYYVVLTEDITEKKKNEEELSNYMYMIEQSTEEIAFADLKGNVLFTNDAWAKNHGYKKEEIIGRHLSMFHTKKELVKVKADIHNLFKTGRTTVEIIHKRKDGSTYIALMNNFILTVDGKRKYIVGMANDITQRKKEELDLKKREELIRSINDHLPKAMLYQIIRDKKGTRRFTYVSKNVHRFYGCSPEEAIKDPKLIYGKVAREDRVRLLKEEEKAFHRLTTFSIEVMMYYPSGKIRWSLFSASPTRLKDGTTRWDGVEVDITDKKNIEIELHQYRDHLEYLVQERTLKFKESEHKFRTLAENSGDIITRFDKNYRIIFINKAVEKVSPLRSFEYFGKSVYELPFPRALAMIWDAAIKEVFKTGQLQRREFQLPDGIWIDWFIFPEFAKGKKEVTTAISFGRDITQLKEIEQKITKNLKEYQNLIENIPGMVYKASSDWTVSVLSKNAKEVSGYSSDELDIGKINWLKLIHRLDKQRVIRECISLHKKPSFLIQEYRITQKSGNIVWVRDIKRSFFEKGKLSHIEGIIFNIDEHKKSEEEVQKKTIELQEKVLELERFSKIAVGRELRMIELKEKMKDMERKQQV